MTARSRRAALGTMVGFGMALSFAPAFTANRKRIAFPDQPMKLWRRIDRSLSDGERVRVDRAWQVIFSRQS